MFSNRMSQISPGRIVELWPSLSEEARQRIVDLAENSAVTSGRYQFSSEELIGIERGRDDLEHGRTSSLPEFRSEMDAFFNRLKANKG
jgi:hypothetical protein